jgi:acyl-CoA thioester hydrolase
VNAYLIQQCGLKPSSSSEVGLVVHSHCDYFGSVAYPEVVDLALRVKKLGKSSVEYEIGVFSKNSEDIKAVGGFIHVFVDRASNRPAVNGMNTVCRDGLAKILAKEAPKI